MQICDKTLLKKFRTCIDPSHRQIKSARQGGDEEEERKNKEG